MTTADTLNRDCQCVWVDAGRLAKHFHKPAPPHMFSSVPLFVSAADLAAMRDAVRQLHQTLLAQKDRTLAEAPEIARFDPGTPGVLYGYDFHLSDSGPKLIEINTNAGGAMLNVALAANQRACCPGFEEIIPVPPDAGRFIAMFQREWELFRPGTKLRSIAIVDEAPETQFLYPEMILFRDAFIAAGIEAKICEPDAIGDVDLVYNRLTDFYLDRYPALREAYLQKRVLLTPHPHGHAVFASKDNLIALSRLLPDIVPHTERVTEAHWAERKRFFFKPTHGFGSKAAYRGDKLTKGTFADILAGDYIAQQIVPPSVRNVEVDGQITPLKVDIRAYAYEGEVQLFAARLYAGQTTNMRTPGGGFAPVFST